MKMQFMNEKFRYDVLNNETIEKKKLLIQNYLFHRNLQFHKLIKTSPSVLPGCGTRTKLICTPTNLSFPNHHTVLGETPVHHTIHTSQF